MAIRVVREIEIERPATEVFDFLARGENLPRWMDEFAVVEKITDGPPTLGTTYYYRMKRGAESTFVWEDFESPRRLVWHGPPAGSGFSMLEPRGSWELEESGPSTRVRMTMEPGTGRLMRLLSPLLERSIEKGTARDFERLKAILEGRE